MGELTLRQVTVLERLLRSTGRVTLGDLAAAAGVSGRTLQRDLPALQAWLAGNGLALQVRPRHGLEVEGSDEQRQQALARLHDETPQRPLSAGDRQSLILQELLHTRDGLKLAYFAHRYGVTEVTISHDLDRLEPWLLEHGLRLVRRPGTGLRLEGAERAFRSAIMDVLHASLTDEQLYNMLRDLLRGEPRDSGVAGTRTATVTRRLLQFVDESTVNRMETAVREVGRLMGGNLADSAVVGLVVHLALAVQRLRRQEQIRFPAETLAELRLSREWDWARWLAARISAVMDIPIPEDEIGYITMHLKGARLRNAASGWDWPDPDRLEAQRLARAMVAEAERLLDAPLSQDPGLVDGLVVHLVPSISRLRLGLEIRNPLLGQIKAEYPGLFQTSREVAGVLADYLRLPVPEAEVGFVTMHLGAALERWRAGRRPHYRTVVVCATGIGSSRMLASRVASAVPELDVIQLASALELPDLLENRQGPPPDLILTTVPLEAVEVPTVVVSPLMRAEDVEAVREALRRLPPSPAESPSPGAPPEASRASAPEQSVRRAVVMGQVVLGLLQSFRLQELGDRPPVEAACDLLAAAGLPFDRDTVRNDLRRREDMGPTEVTDRMRLLHARTAGVAAPFLGLLRSRQGAILVMLAPAEVVPEAMEMLGAVSSALVERPDLPRTLENEPEEEIKQVLGNILQPLLFRAGRTAPETGVSHDVV